MSGSELPDSWIVARLEEIAGTSSGGTPSRSKAGCFGGSIPWVKSGELNDGLVLTAGETLTEQGLAHSSAKLFPKGTLCIALYGATVGRVGILGLEAATNQAVCGVSPANGVATQYLFYFLQSQRRNLIHQSQGGAQPNISQEIVRAIEVPLCSPSEQGRIVAEIDKQFTRLDAATAALKRVQANLKRYRASVLKAACEGRLVPTEAELARKEGRDYEPADQLLQRILLERRTRWEADTLAKMIASGKPPKDDRWKQKYKEPIAPDTSNFPELPEGWCWASLSQLSWTCDYGISNKCGYEGEGPPVLRIPNIQSGQIDFGDLKRAMMPTVVRTGDELKLGDLLIIRTNGSKNLIGRCALIERSCERVMLHASYLIRFRMLTVGQWLRDIWDSSFNRNSIEALAATSAGQYNVSMTVLEKLTFPIPPLAEIERIRFKLTDANLALRRTEAAMEENLLRARLLRSGVLSSAFAGQLTSQESGDEPASVLLERIRAERTSQTPRRSQRRRKEPVRV